ncbi:MAG TPA: DUF2703 domain-containing protein [Solirubrobacterales bacterium]|nr:DUF2703 domain-containing protein [Solirubrobacterales bacterium]
MATQTDSPARRVRIDLLYLDIATCTRCRGAERNVESALDAARDLLAATGIHLELHKAHVDSAEQARELRLESSPTVRINGRDVALELRESPCESDPCSDGHGEPISCRVWAHDGQEHTEPPVAMILDAILRELYGGASAAPSQLAKEPFQLPENLERFFASKADASGAEPGDESAGEQGCCSTAEQQSCCGPGDKAECCGGSLEGGCGCR